MSNKPKTPKKELLTLPLDQPKVHTNKAGRWKCKLSAAEMDAINIRATIAKLAEAAKSHSATPKPNRPAN